MSRPYCPDDWIIIEVKGLDPHYRVLGGWGGSYLHGSSWRLNSGITKATYSSKDGYYEFHGSSGSVYRCHKDSYRLSMNSVDGWERLQQLYQEKVSMMEPDNDWENFDWIIS